ncbi:serine/threonine-protein kinase [Actinosynnema sp. NPDC023587]|uniref:serine/threonine-protein kinase n=1 Tax=Actinosynnema sp. NPDC023587 TaxID=3154695 RepID=UPI0033F77B61
MTGPQGVNTQPRVIAGRYALLGELGRGGMGVVWRAQDNVIGRQVAIKELHLPDGIAHEERRVLEERVLREARTAGRLNDPGVVTVFDVVAEHGTNYIVMELVEAATLSTIVAQGGPLPQDRVIPLAVQALSALDTAHQAGIVHRDVKPGNLMVQPNGRVKLTDFGIAQAVDDPRLTTSGSLIGSPAYMSPERIHGHEASPASDLWALGATLCYAVEGANPYERSTTASTLHAIMNEMPRLTRAHGVLGAVITGLMMPDPNARLSGPQARAMLERAVAQPTPPQGFTGPNPTMQYQPQPPSGNQSPRKPWVRNLIAVAAGLAAVVLFVGGIVVDRWLFGDNPPAAMAETVTVGGGGQLPEFTLSVNQCGDNFLADSVRVGSADCDSEHNIEVYAQGDPFGSLASVAYPGDDYLKNFAEDYCTLVFASARVPTEDKDTTLRYAAVVPTAAEWKESYSASKGSRDITCVLWSKDRALLKEQVYAEK